LAHNIAKAWFASYPEKVVAILREHRSHRWKWLNSNVIHVWEEVITTSPHTSKTRIYDLIYIVDRVDKENHVMLIAIEIKTGKFTRKWVRQARDLVRLKSWAPSSLPKNVTVKDKLVMFVAWRSELEKLRRVFQHPHLLLAELEWFVDTIVSDVCGAVQFLTPARSYIEASLTLSFDGD
jgi:hypothetical protein